MMGDSAVNLQSPTTEKQERSFYEGILSGENECSLQILLI